MLFFMPEWGDCIDPLWVTDRSRKPQPYARAHEVFPQGPYDGIVLSAAARGMTSRDLARIPEEMEVLGDCGAFSYIKDPSKQPSIETALAWYRANRVTHGTSPDHVITRQMAEEERQARWDITLKNAREFLLSTRNDTFTPVGAVQGWDPASYGHAAYELVQMGYTFLALGSMVRRGKGAIEEILAEVRRLAPHATLHLFGVGRPHLREMLEKYNVRSADSSGYLRAAWMLTGQEYIDTADKGWPAVGHEAQDSDFLFRPWEWCDCPMCGELGYEIMIRGPGERNARRGFHNVYVQWRLFNGETYDRARRLWVPQADTSLSRE
jgi:hypothetical protein